MKGLFLNRWYTVRVSLLIMFGISMLMFLFNLVVGWLINGQQHGSDAAQSMFLLPPIALFLFMEIGAGGIQDDINKRFLSYVLCGPVSIAKYILYNYISAFVMVLLGAVVVFTAGFAASGVYSFQITNDTVSFIFVGLLCIMLFEAIQMPITFKVKKYELSGMITGVSMISIGIILSLIFGYESLETIVKLYSSITGSALGIVLSICAAIALFCISGVVSYYILRTEER